MKILPSCFVIGDSAFATMNASSIPRYLTNLAKKADSWCQFIILRICFSTFGTIQTHVTKPHCQVLLNLVSRPQKLSKDPQNIRICAPPLKSLYISFWRPLSIVRGVLTEFSPVGLVEPPHFGQPPCYLRAVQWFRTGREVETVSLEHRSRMSAHPHAIRPQSIITTQWPSPSG